MARERDPNRDKAFKLFEEHGGDITNREIAKRLDIDEKVVAVWKGRDKWLENIGHVVQQKDGNVVQQKRNVVQRKKKKKASKAKKTGKAKKQREYNRNPPNQFAKRNTAALKHGFFSRHIPQETLDLMGDLETMSPADILWQQITLQYAAIIRAQSIMWVQDKDDNTKELKRIKYGGIDSEGEGEGEETGVSEVEYELQFSWDKQARFLTAQARAITELRTSIKQFVSIADEEDERRFKLKQMRLNIEKTKLEIDKIKEGDAPGGNTLKVEFVKRSGNTPVEADGPDDIEEDDDVS